MNHRKTELAAGLYLVATPIGTARDITLRALDTLASADVLAAEDTRSLRRLMEIHGVPLNGRSVVAYHDHSAQGVRNKLLEFIKSGKSVAYASEAGTPLIADPGFDLARDIQAEDLMVTSVPGPSAVISALTLAGLPTDAFFFAGFLPNAAQARSRRLEDLKDIPGTLVFYESPKRLASMLKDASRVFGAERQACVCRELTKKFEEARRGPLVELETHYAGASVKGEIVVLIDRLGAQDNSPADIEAALKTALETMSVRDAAETVAQAFGEKKRKIYQLALKLGED